ncbi:MAG: hypothetical protein HW390_1867 [Candidatus Brocadiaceae bacterium]|nr:hypothetical protein [Candidatus Brocadiaceae bacterium]
MTTMIAELYDALKEAGASEEKAIAAAKSIADYENRFVRMESKIDSLELKIESEVGALGSRLESEVGSTEPKFGTKIASLESKFNSLEAEIKIVKTELRRIKWLLGFGIAGTISLIIKAFI